MSLFRHACSRACVLKTQSNYRTLYTFLPELGESLRLSILPLQAAPEVRGAVLLDAVGVWLLGRDVVGDCCNDLLHATNEPRENHPRHSSQKSFQALCVKRDVPLPLRMKNAGRHLSKVPSLKFHTHTHDARTHTHTHTRRAQR